MHLFADYSVGLTHLTQEIQGDPAGIRQSGRFNTVVITSFTAIDRERTCIKLAVIAERQGRGDAELQAELEGYMKEHAAVAEQDFQIWEHKRYEPKPVLCDGDGPIAEHRQWARQFYVDSASQ